jgi:hypothetical protein
MLPTVATAEVASAQETEVSTQETDVAAQETEVPTQVTEVAAQQTEVAVQETVVVIQVTAAATEVVEATIEPTLALPYNTDNYSIGGARAIEQNLSEDLPEPPEDHRWVLVLSTIFNRSAQPVTINSDNLWVLDDSGNTHFAVDFGDEDLVGLTIDAEGRYSGVALFAIPRGADWSVIQWCPLEPDCTQPMQTVIA